MEAQANFILSPDDLKEHADALKNISEDDGVLEPLENLGNVLLY